ncbi:aminoglycoside phosphotransferase family protein [Kitasatospora sp. NPDC002040]|uniref:aminoglycoside phosphotransferase family protein n=1 Tax=Kitasatospora sp. NPDC002040 TaxID=3154661 RepID=UPI00332641F8
MTPAVLTALEAASASRGFDTRGAHLFQQNLNWVVRMPNAAPGGSVIAKIHTPGTEQAAVIRQVLTAEWLDDNGILTTRPAGTRRPIQVGAHLVTFTHDLGVGMGGPVPPEELGRLLARLHALTVPDHLGLPRLDPAADLLARIRKLPDHVLDPDDRHWLTSHLQAAGELFESTDWPGEPVVLHGDLANQNLLRTRAGLALLDLEYVAVGWALHDLAFRAWIRDGFSDAPRRYDRFCAAYGTDVTTVHGGRPYAQVLAPLRAAVGVVIALEASLRALDWAEEAAYRLMCLRNQEDPRFAYPWRWSSARIFHSFRTRFWIFCRAGAAGGCVGLIHWHAQMKERGARGVPRAPLC